MKQLAKVYSTLRKDKFLFAIIFSIEFFLNLSLIRCMEWLLDYSLQMNLPGFTKVSLNFCLLLVIYVLSIFIEQYLFRKLNGFGELLLQKSIYKNFLESDLLSKSQRAGELASHMNRDAEVISRWLSTGPTNMTLQMAMLCAYLLIMASRNFIISGATIIIILIVFAFSKMLAQREANYVSMQQEEYAKINSEILDILRNRDLIYELNNTSFFKSKLKASHIYIGEIVFKGLSKYTSLRGSILVFMTNMLPAIVLVFGIFLAKIEKASASDAMTLMLIAQKLNEPIILLADLITDQKKAHKVYTRLDSLYSNNMREYPNIPVPKFESIKVHIDGFKYSDGDEQLLSGVQFQFKKGDIVLIKAASGRGKSTLVRLISKLAPTDNMQGSIEYNDHPIQEFSPMDYYKHVLLVDRAPALIDGNVYENLFWGDEFPEEWINEVIDACVLRDFVNCRGKEHSIRADGSNTSGGEQQRIGLARMLLRKPEIIILDEVTSALDPKTKAILLKRVISLAQKYGITIVSISHDNEFDQYCTKRIDL